MPKKGLKMNIKNLKYRYLHPIKIAFYELEIFVLGAWRFFLKEQKSQEKKMIKEYYNNTSDDTKAFTNEIIFTCNGLIWHGGLADRLKGAISIYEWCKKNNKIFKINFCHPFRLENYLIPNYYNWLTDDVVYNNKISIPKICLTEQRACGKRNVQNNYEKYINQWLNNNLNIKDKQIHVYTNTRLGNKNFSVLFNELFKPSERLQFEIDKNQKQLGNKYISISFRFTTIMGDFTDCAGTEYSEKNKVQLLKSCVQAVKDIRKNAPLHDKVLITADSERFLNYAKDNLEDIYIIPGKVGHIDYNNSDNVNMKTFLDFMLISKAEKIYLVKNKDMYNSAFARTAAMVNNKGFEVINI